jgi:hypothetical protein
MNVVQIISAALLCLLLALVPSPPAAAAALADSGGSTAASEFRDAVLPYARATAAHAALAAPMPAAQPLRQRWDSRYRQNHWSIAVTLYRQGRKIGQGAAREPRLTDSLQHATERALADTGLRAIDADTLNSLVFKIAFAYPPGRAFSIIEADGKGLELLGNRIALRQLDTALIRQRIAAGGQYLLGVMDPELHGFFKKYDAQQDRRSPVLRTIYSASSLYTLLKLRRYTGDQQLDRNFEPIAGFLLSMQKTSGENAGGFYYAYRKDSGEKTCRLVVGTASKTIFTLLELHRFYAGDDTYLAAARHAGDWLLGMIEADGRVMSAATCEGDSWHYDHRHSLLYTGQVLTALSRLYGVSRDPRYLAGASRIAQYLMATVARQGAFLGDDFRPPNTISTSWVTLALIDYAKINPDPLYPRVVQRTAAAILARQIHSADDAYNHGRYLDTMTTSGNGWINEVMGELYGFCNRRQLSGCRDYRDAMLLTSRWLLQNTYTPAGSYDLANPAPANGGFVRNYISHAVRTDAVCHGLNSLIALMNDTAPDARVLLTLPERPFEETLGLLRIGSGGGP